MEVPEPPIAPPPESRHAPCIGPASSPGHARDEEARMEFFAVYQERVFTYSESA